MFMAVTVFVLWLFIVESPGTKPECNEVIILLELKQVESMFVYIFFHYFTYSS